MAKFTKDGHTVETSFPNEITRLRAEGFIEVSDAVEPDPAPAAVEDQPVEPEKPAPAPGPKPAAKPAK